MHRLTNKHGSGLWQLAGTVSSPPQSGDSLSSIGWAHRFCADMKVRLMDAEHVAIAALEELSHLGEPAMVVLSLVTFRLRREARLEHRDVELSFTVPSRA